MGPVVAAFLIGYTSDIGRFATADHYAAYNGTAPIEVSSGGKKRHRLSMRGNRVLNHAIHMAAITQIRHDTPGRVYYDKKLTEGKNQEGSPPSVETTDLHRRLPETSSRPTELGPEGHPGTSLSLAWPASHPDTGSSAQPPRAAPKPTPLAGIPGPVQRAQTPRLDTKRLRYVRLVPPSQIIGGKGLLTSRYVR